jgi:hypothetical protein
MNPHAPPKKKEHGVGTALKTAQLTAGYRSPVFSQLFRSRTVSGPRCVVCGSHVTNRNLGGNDGRSALSGNLWCLRCADYPRQPVFIFGGNPP